METTKVDGSKIKDALAVLHYVESPECEARMTRVKAAEHVIKLFRLNLVEAGILLRAVNVERHEVNVQWGD